MVEAKVWHGERLYDLFHYHDTHPVVRIDSRLRQEPEAISGFVVRQLRVKGKMFISSTVHANRRIFSSKTNNLVPPEMHAKHGIEYQFCETSLVGGGCSHGTK